MYRKRFLVTAAALTGGLVAGLAVPAHAQSLALRRACEVVVVAVTAADIQEESDGQDEIWVRVGGSWFPSYLSSTTFTEGQIRTHDELNQPKATKVGDFVKLEIHEDDPWPQANDFLGEEDVSCADGGTGPGGDVAIIGGSGVSYVVSYFSQQVFI
jgi:hypothetical protein